MDPFLEDPSLWPGVHHRLIGTIGESLAQALRPSYFVDVERRVYVLDEDDPARRIVIPDVTVVGGMPQSLERPAARLKRAPTTLLMAIVPIDMAESRLVIRGVGGDRGVVTVIEGLSPANKIVGSRGREEYLAKRREVLRSRVHLVEIDLLRAGARFPSVDPLPRGDYFVHVSRAQGRPRGDVFAWPLREEVPEVPVPLAGNDEASLDLGRVIHDTYDRNGYDVAIDYDGKCPDPPLSREDQAWLAARLAARR
jgi:hypothetical protein